jgi:hypothetical protein
LRCSKTIFALSGSSFHRGQSSSVGVPNTAITRAICSKSLSPCNERVDQRGGKWRDGISPRTTAIRSPSRPICIHTPTYRHSCCSAWNRRATRGRGTNELRPILSAGLDIGRDICFGICCWFSRDL